MKTLKAILAVLIFLFWGNGLCAQGLNLLNNAFEEAVTSKPSTVKTVSEPVNQTCCNRCLFHGENCPLSDNELSVLHRYAWVILHRELGTGSLKLEFEGCYKTEVMPYTVVVESVATEFASFEAAGDPSGKCRISATVPAVFKIGAERLNCTIVIHCSGPLPEFKLPRQEYLRVPMRLKGKRPLTREHLANKQYAEFFTRVKSMTAEQARQEEYERLIKMYEANEISVYELYQRYLEQSEFGNN